MKPLTISDADVMVLGLQGEIRRSEESRYDHRLHGTLLVAQGMTCAEVARLLGDAPHTVVNWVHNFERDGLAGLMEGERMGRPTCLSESQLEEVQRVLRGSPEDEGLTGHLWDGKTLSAYLEKRYGVELGVRQCQRLFRQFGFRLRKPRGLVAKADPQLQEAHKKTPQNGEKS